MLNIKDINKVTVYKESLRIICHLLIIYASV